MPTRIANLWRCACGFGTADSQRNGVDLDAQDTEAGQLHHGGDLLGRAQWVGAGVGSTGVGSSARSNARQSNHIAPADDLLHIRHRNETRLGQPTYHCVSPRLSCVRDDGPVQPIRQASPHFQRRPPQPTVVGVLPLPWVCSACKRPSPIECSSSCRWRAPSSELASEGAPTSAAVFGAVLITNLAPGVGLVIVTWFSQAQHCESVHW